MTKLEFIKKVKKQKGENMKLSVQEKKVLKHIKEYGYITSMDAFNFYNITRLSDRIFRLRNKGYLIDTELIAKKNDDGGVVNFAAYRLLEEPTYFAENREESRLGI